MGILALAAILPCMHVVSKSISNGADVIAGNVYFLPKGFQLDTITYLLTQTSYLNALKNSLIITVCGTLLSVFTTITTAYPLSKSHFKGRRVISLLYVFSMVFYGGMIPAYMVVRSLGILDTYLACILPFAIVQFNMFIVKNYFESLPESVEESAHIDGAGDVRTLVSIVCPVSKPVIATVSLLYAVTYWNNYFHAMMYTKSSEMNTLQVYLYNLIQNGQAVAEGVSSGTYTINVTSPGLNAAAVTLTLIPMLLLYPFVARYMIQGITIGSVKG
jgi:putative aldouronate transport system permease protein